MYGNQTNREIYWLLVEAMYRTAQKHNSQFAVLCLEDSNYPRVSELLGCLSDSELQQLNASLKEPLVFPPPYPYDFVGNGRDGEPDMPKFHVCSVMSNHPSALCQVSWGRNIGDWFEDWRQR